MTLWAVVPAAGGGTRLGADTPKQYLSIAGKPMLRWSVEALLSCGRISQCVVALAPKDECGARVLAGLDVRLCPGGATRVESVLAGIAALDAQPDDWVLVHDAARPCVSVSSIQRLIDTVLGSDIGGLLAHRQTDTVKRADDRARVEATLSREHLWCAQTPQMFRVAALQTALANALAAGEPVTDEASAMERAGHPVQLVESSARNLKVTYAEDLPVAELWLASAVAGSTTPVAARQRVPG